MQRREFVQTAAQVTAFTALSMSRVMGANDRVVVALVGCGGRGRGDARGMKESPNMEFGAMCDVYDTNAARASKELTEGQAKTYRDFRQVLERKDIDAILVATPDHWHAIPTVLGLQAGKHVFVEKPFSLTIREGRAMVEASKRANRVLQVGTQHRSSAHIQEAARIVQSGEIGEVPFVRVWNSGNIYPNMSAKVPDSNPPPDLDWDFYLGPAPKVPFNQRRFLSTYRLFFDYNGGYITDYGNHRFDSVQHIMNVTAPLTVAASGKRIATQNAGDIPDVIQATYEYPGFILDYGGDWLSMHGLGGRSPGMQYYSMSGPYNRPHGMAFYGTKGALFVDRVGFEIFPEIDPASRRRRGGDEDPNSGEVQYLKFLMERKTYNGSDAQALHAQNFIKVILGTMKPFADGEIGHRSTTVPLLGNIAYHTGRKLRWNAEKEDFENDPEASKLLSREKRKPWDLI